MLELTVGNVALDRSSRRKGIYSNRLNQRQELLAPATECRTLKTVGGHLRRLLQALGG